MRDRLLIYVTIFISIVTYLFWDIIKIKTGISIFWIGNASSVFIMALIIFLNNKKLFSSFFLLCITFNNLLDELFFEPTKIGLNEIVFAILIIIIYYARKISTRGIFRTFYKNSLSRFFNRSDRSCSRNEK